MGFYEDDRIRHKNAAYNEAVSQYEELKNQYWSDADIVTFASTMLENNPNSKAVYELLKIAVAKSKSHSEQTTHNQD